MEVIWSPSILHLIKGNTDGTSVNNSFAASAGGIFRNSEGTCLNCFAQHLGPGSALYAELFAVMFAIELARRKG
jgi:hypothetical protein